MPIQKKALISAILFSLAGCTANNGVEPSKTEKVEISQSEIDLMIERAKATERALVLKELEQQKQQKIVYDELLIKEGKTAKFSQHYQQPLNQQKMVDEVAHKYILKEIELGVRVATAEGGISKITPKDRTVQLYQTLDGVDYYRCAANSMVPEQTPKGVKYRPNIRELSATLCKKSRNKTVMLKLQQKLFDLGYLKSDTLTKEQLVDGFWGASTLNAVKAYQADKGLLFGQMSIQTLEHIGVFTAYSAADDFNSSNIVKVDTKSEQIKQPKQPDNQQTPVEANESQALAQVEQKIESTVSEMEQTPTFIEEDKTVEVAALESSIQTSSNEQRAVKEQVEEIKAEVTAENPAENPSKEASTSEQLSEEVTEQPTEKTTKQEQTQEPEPAKTNLVEATDKTENTESTPNIPENATYMNGKVVLKIIPENRNRAFYQKVGGASYYRCAANSMVPVKMDDGAWQYSEDKQELSATLCKANRDGATMTDLQYELHEKGYMPANGTPIGFLISGDWDKRTLKAVKAYQKDKGLLYGQLTIETLESLGIFKPHKERVLQVGSEASSVKTAVAEQNQPIEETQVAKLTKTENVESESLDSPENSENMKSDSTAKDEIPFVALAVKYASPKIDPSSYVPNSGIATPYAYVGNFALNRCRARALLPMQTDAGISYNEDNKAFRATLCKMNRTIKLMTRLQTALRDKGFLKPLEGHNTVTIDGIWGSNTLEAVKAYQKQHGLAYGQLTIEVIEHLGVWYED